MVELKDRIKAAEERIKAAEAKRQSHRDAETAERLEQLAVDSEAISELEATHGDGRIIAIELSSWKPGEGCPVKVAVRVPRGSERLCQRFIEQINRAKEGSKDRIVAQDALATECWVYPEKGSDGFKAALEASSLILSHAALQIVKASQGRAEDEGKG
jgi:hypothetical protein